MFEGINHIVIFCKDTSVSKHWYERLGFDYLNGYEGMHWFMFNGQKLMIHPVEEANPGLTTIHIGVKDVNNVFDHCFSQGLEPIDHQQPGEKINSPVRRPWGAIEFELIDPDGHKWAFTQIQ